MKKIFLLLLVSATFSSCKKDSDKPQTKSTYDLLINKKWLLIGESGIVDGVYYPENPEPTPEYFKDDYFFFYSNWDYEVNSGKLLDPNNPKQITDQGTWRLSNNDKSLELKTQSTDIITYPLTIVELTETKLSLEYTIPENGNIITDKFKAIP